MRPRSILAALLAPLALLLAALAPASGALAADGDDHGLGQRCVVHLDVVGATVHRRATSPHGTGMEWVREPLWRVRGGGSTMWETRARRGRGCTASVLYEGPGRQTFSIFIANPVEGAPTHRCTARGTGTFNCTVRKRPRTPRTVVIDVRIRFGR
jgi:hypothetical protein